MSPSEKPNVLVIDDDADFCLLLKTILNREGMEARTALSGDEGMQVLYGMKPDLVLLDIMMPGESGWDVTHRIRTLTDVPIIIISALSQTTDIVRSLEAGADDFINKPFDTEELLARIRAVVRRATVFHDSPEYIHDYNDGYLSVDLPNGRVFIEKQERKLSVTEWKMFEHLFLHAGHVCSAAELLAHVWGAIIPNGTKYLHVYVWKLRNKIERDPGNPIYIHTDHGTGYRFERRSVA